MTYHVAAILILILGVWGCSSDEYVTYECDLETFARDVYIGEKGRFTHGATRSSEESYKGTYSALLSSSNQYGPILELKDVGPGDRFVYSVWVKFLKSTAKAGVQFHNIATDYTVRSDGAPQKVGEWYKFTYEHIVPEDAIRGECAVYPKHFEGDGDVFVDDISIKYYKTGTENNLVESDSLNFDPEEIELFFKTSDFGDIREKRDEAIEKGLLFSSKDDLRPAHLKIGESQYSVRARLKGDLLDHLRGDKWSFRLMLSGNDEWRNMQIFSVHNSAARSQLAEWVMHELFRAEGIITPQYDFCKLKLNDKSLGVYAYEQHFDNALLEANKKPIAPILKQNDEGYWHNVNKKVEPFNWTAASHVELFNKENDDPEFIELYRVAHSLLEDFSAGRKDANEVFDLDKMATYYALLEISHAIHAQQFTNIRFYYNPFIGLLEPIGYDCFGDHLPNVTQGWRSMGEAVTQRKAFYHERGLSSHFEDRLFANKEFFKSYIKDLKKFSSVEYLSIRRDELKNEIAVREQFIQSDKEYEGYDFDWDLIFKKASYTAQKIDPLPEYSLTVYNKESRKDLALRSTHYFPMEVVAYVGERDTSWLKEPIAIPGYNLELKNEFVNVRSPIKAKEILVRTLGLDQLFSYPVQKQEPPIPFIPILTPMADEDLDRFDFLNKVGDELHVIKSTIMIDEPLLIGKNISVFKIPAGTSITFKGNGAIISEAPIEAFGTDRRPIVFIGKSTSGNGILITRAEAVSTFKNCRFVGLSGVRSGQYSSDGMLSSYESVLSIDQCEFSKSIGHAALNCINTRLFMINSMFHKAYQNAVVLKYSNARINKTSFDYIAKHAVSVYSTELNCDELKLTEVGGTGLKIRDDSKVRVDKTIFTHIESAIGVSGGANFNAYDIELNDVEIGFSVLSDSESKTEAAIYAKELNDVDLLYVLDRKSNLKINGASKKPL